ncbi:MAG: hypothetical protein AAGD05_08180 [Bacteroidota bacterium]
MKILLKVKDLQGKAIVLSFFEKSRLKGGQSTTTTAPSDTLPQTDGIVIEDLNQI